MKILKMNFDHAKVVITKQSTSVLALQIYDSDNSLLISAEGTYYTTPRSQLAFVDFLAFLTRVIDENQLQPFFPDFFDTDFNQLGALTCKK